jgi:hypothetical protein
VSGCHAGPTCPRGRRRARALLGLGRRWAERKVEEEVDCGEERSWPHAGEEEESGPRKGKGKWAAGEERREAGRAGLGSGFALLFPSLFLF